MEHVSHDAAESDDLGDVGEEEEDRRRQHLRHATPERVHVVRQVPQHNPLPPRPPPQLPAQLRPRIQSQFDLKACDSPLALPLEVLHEASEGSPRAHDGLVDAVLLDLVGVVVLVSASAATAAAAASRGQVDVADVTCGLKSPTVDEPCWRVGDGFKVGRGALAGGEWFRPST